MNESINELAQKILEHNFWSKLNPSMSICSCDTSFGFVLDETEQQYHQNKLLNEGYIHLKAPGTKVDLNALVDVFQTIDNLGLPPVFAFVYDEAWLLNTQLKNFLSYTLGTNYFLLPDFWAWLVKPGESGWIPHRDKPNGRSPQRDIINSVTAWVPLTEAHPQNSCMYVLPADRDPMYGVPNSPSGFPGQLTDIRALPAAPGDVLIWTQQIMHWGSHAADEHNMKPRMNVAFEYQRGDIGAYNQPLLEPDSLLSFEQRIALIARMIMQYKQMYNFTDDLMFLAQTMRNAYQLPGKLMRDIY